MRIDAVRVDGRYRKDLGDIAGLAASIREIGLLNPITVTADGRLIAGERRLEAVRSLGMDTIPAYAVDDLDGAVAKLRAERDENTERKEMTISERVALAAALEDLVRPKIEARRDAKLRQNRSGQLTGTAEEPHGETREVVATAVGMSPTTYNRAKQVVKAATDPTLPGAAQQAAREAMAEMDATGLVAGAYEKVRGIRSATLGAPVKPGISGAPAQRKAIAAALTSLSGIGYGLKQVTELHPDITSAEAAQWVDGLSEARRILEALIKRCKERTNNA